MSTTIPGPNGLAGLYVYQATALRTAHEAAERIRGEAASTDFYAMTPQGAAEWFAEKIAEEIMGLLLDADRQAIECGGGTVLTAEQIAYMGQLGIGPSTPPEVKRWLQTVAAAPADPTHEEA